MDELLKKQLAENEAQLEYWREQEIHASRQVVMWQGAVEGLRRLEAAVKEAEEQQLVEEEVA